MWLKVQSIIKFFFGFPAKTLHLYHNLGRTTFFEKFPSLTPTSRGFSFQKPALFNEKHSSLLMQTTALLAAFASSHILRASSRISGSSWLCQNQFEELCFAEEELVFEKKNLCSQGLGMEFF